MAQEPAANSPSGVFSSTSFHAGVRGQRPSGQTSSSSSRHGKVTQAGLASRLAAKAAAVQTMRPRPAGRT